MSTHSASWGNYLLKDLSETPLPEAISWWPQTLGWQIVVGFTLIDLMKWGYQRYRRYKRNYYRREAITWLTQLPHDHPDVLTDYRQLPTLLRSVALKAYDRRLITQLSGQDWVDWLNRQCQSPCFSAQSAQLLHQLAYGASPSFTTVEIQQLCREMTLWCAVHREET